MATGSYLTAVKEEEEEDDSPNHNAFYKSLGAMTVADINGNDFRKRVIRRRWLDIATSISRQLEIAANIEIDRHRIEGEVLTRQDLVNMSAEGVSYLAAALCTAERFETVKQNPATGDKNLEEFIFVLIQELETDAKRDID